MENKQTDVKNQQQKKKADCLLTARDEIKHKDTDRVKNNRNDPSFLLKKWSLYINIRQSRFLVRNIIRNKDSYLL